MPGRLTLGASVSRWLWGGVASAIPGAAWGQTWGYTGSDYGTAANWIPNGVPGPGQTATFNSAAGVQPIASHDYTIGTVNQTAGVPACRSERRGSNSRIATPNIRSIRSVMAPN